MNRGKGCYEDFLTDKQKESMHKFIEEHTTPKAYGPKKMFDKNEEAPTE